jgi:hypothetical protein
MKKQSFVFTENGFQALVGYNAVNARKDHPRYGVMERLAKQAMKAEKNGEDSEALWDDFMSAYNGTYSEAHKEVVKATQTMEGIELRDGQVYFDGQPLDNAVIPVIRRYVRDDIDPSSLLNFLRRLMNNPSHRSVEQLWRFVESNDLSIDNDGFILFYKVVTNDYKDKHTKTFDNRPGVEQSCHRNQVDDDPNAACSKGFHVGGWRYSGVGGEFYTQGDRIVICKVDPADVVSVPKDAQAGKCRVCKYTVVADYKGKLVPGITPVEGNDTKANACESYDSLRTKENPEDGPRSAVDEDLFDSVNDGHGNGDFDDEGDGEDEEDEDEEDYSEDDDFEEDEDLEDEDDFEDDEDLEDEDEDDFGSGIALTTPTDIWDNLASGDTVRLKYDGVERRCEVNMIDEHTLNGRLLKGDPSWKGAFRNALIPDYRNFSRDKVSDLRID